MKKTGKSFNAIFVLGLLGLLLVLVMGSVLITDRLYNQEQFNIKKITLTGDAAHVDRQQLQTSVIEMIEGNYFSLNSASIVETILTLPWRRASLSNDGCRELPQIIPRSMSAGLTLLLSGGPWACMSECALPDLPSLSYKLVAQTLPKKGKTQTLTHQNFTNLRRAGKRQLTN